MSRTLHVYLVRPRFGWFLWKAAQDDGSNGPLKDTNTESEMFLPPHRFDMHYM